MPEHQGDNMELQNRIAAGTLALVAVFAFQSPAEAQVTFASSSNDAPLTYSADVASIIQENCTVCHRAGGIGPMELVTYQDAGRYSRRIKEKVEGRLMPPYYYDRDVGIQDLKEDWRLSEEDINTIVSWVDQGAPLGNADEMSHAWIAVTHLDEEGYERLVEERKMDEDERIAARN
jgi:mono/diheme cytochrome c family protein